MESERARWRAASEPVLVVGQGLAGTLLAWALERAGREFLIVDAGHAGSASRVGAGLVNPVTGERWVAAVGWAERSAEARGIYREMEATWGRRFVSELRIRREWGMFLDFTEGTRGRHGGHGEGDGGSRGRVAELRAKVERGELAPWVRPEAAAADTAWIEGAWRVDLPALIAAGRERWSAAGRLREVRAEEVAADWEGPVVWCVGAAETRVPKLRPVDGETLELAVETAPGGGPDAWRADVVRHDGVWVLPVAASAEGVVTRAWAGASFVREEAERSARRDALRASAKRQLADLRWREEAVLAGRRMTSADRVPFSGWLPGREGREGVLNGLGSKGALLAPRLALEWARRLEPS